MSQITNSEYHMAARGEMPPPSEERIFHVKKWVPNLDRLIDTAVTKLYQAVLWSRGDNPKPRNWVCAWDYVEKMLRLSVPPELGPLTPEERQTVLEMAHITVLSLATDWAKTSPRYWGVQDITVESFCSYCKKPRPIGDFIISEHTCDPCFRKRKKTTGGDS